MKKITLNNTGLYIGKAGFIRIIETPLEKNKILRIFGTDKNNNVYIETSKYPLAPNNSDKEITLKMTKNDLKKSSFKYSGVAQLSGSFTATLTKKNGKIKNVFIEKIDMLINKPLNSILNKSSENKSNNQNRPTENKIAQEPAFIKIKEDKIYEDENDSIEPETNIAEIQDIITTTSEIPSFNTNNDLYLATPPLPSAIPSSELLLTGTTSTVLNVITTGQIVNSIIEGNKLLLPTYNGAQNYNGTTIDSAKLVPFTGGIYLYYDGKSMRISNTSPNDFVLLEPLSMTYLPWNMANAEFKDLAERTFYDISKIPPTLTVCLRKYLPANAREISTFFPKGELLSLEEITGRKAIN